MNQATGSKDFFTSDHHFGHESIIRIMERPWDTVQEMEAGLINEWNAVVGKSDRVFVLGDFSFQSAAANNVLLSKLNGQKFLIQGNHDHDARIDVSGRWAWVKTRHTHKINNRKIVLDHFPLLSWNAMHYGAYHLHGHCHGTLTLPECLQNARILDVGIDAVVKWTGSYRPVEWSEIVEHLADKTYSKKQTPYVD